MLPLEDIQGPVPAVQRMTPYEKKAAPVYYLGGSDRVRAVPLPCDKVRIIGQIDQEWSLGMAP
jgi:hypothetical protein